MLLTTSLSVYQVYIQRAVYCCLVPSAELQIIFKSKGYLPPTFENDGYLHISFALLYSLLQEKIAYMYTFKIMLDTSVIKKMQDASEMYISV